MLTTIQLQTLKADIANDPILDALPKNSDGAFAVAAAYNLDADPAFIVWKTDVPTSECKKAMVWTEYIDCSIGQRDAWRFMLSNGTISPADANIRQGIADIFSGPGGAGSRAALITIGKRGVSRFEKLFAVGEGTDLYPGTMTIEGNLSYQEVMNAWNS